MSHPRIISHCVDLHQRYVWNGQHMENVWQFQYGAPNPTPSELASLAAAWDTALRAYYRGLFASDVFLTEILVNDIGGVGLATFTYALPTGQTGTFGGATSAPNAAASVVERSGYRGPSKHGRKSFGPVPSTGISAGTITIGYQNALVALLSHITASWVGGRFILGVGSLATNTVTPINTFVLTDFNLDSQKTRLIGHGY